MAQAAKPAATGPLEAGTLLGPVGRYRLERRLSLSGFGAVYLAYDTRLGRACIVKQLLLDLDWGDQTSRLVQVSFEHEAQLLVSLNIPGHPNIPEIYDYLADGRCLVMKYIVGQSLGDLCMERGGHLPEAEALRYARDICAALVYMHGRQPEPVLHRDIKPANILLDAEGRVWLINFGLFKAITRAALADLEWSQNTESLGYAPAEQWRGRGEPRSDVYALGATLHHLLTGYVPPQTDLLGLIRGVVALPPVRQIVPEIRPTVENLIERAMTFDVADRPTAAELLDGLDAILSRPAIAPPPEPARPRATGDFVGRQAELAHFTDQLAATHMAVISGMSGVGKTALAAVLTHQVADPIKTFWHTFHADEGGEPLIWRLAGFLAWDGRDGLWQQIELARQANAQLPPPEVLCDYLVQLLRGKGYVLCLDDLHLAEDDPVLQNLFTRLESEVRAGQIWLIVITRQAPAFLRASGAPLAGLSDADARTLLERRGLALAEPLVDQLIMVTGGNPQLLLLSIDALRYANNRARVIEHLAEERDIERYLLNQVDAGLTDAERVVLSAMAALLNYGGTRDAIEALLDPRESAGAPTADVYTRYEIGLDALLVQLPRTQDRYADALVYQQRLLENIGQARLYGDTDSRRAERMEIGARLSELSLAALRRSFDDLCGPVALPPAPAAAGEHVRGVRRIVSELADRHLVLVNEGNAGREYRLHAIAQQFYYEQLERHERLALHRRAGSYYETVEPDALRAARHNQYAGEHARAAALVTADIWATINTGQTRALAALLAQLRVDGLEPTLRVAVCTARGEVAALLGEYELARKQLAQALVDGAALDSAPAQIEDQARRRRLLGLVGERTGDYVQAEADCRNGLTLALGLGLPNVEVARLYAQLAEVLYRRSQFDLVEQTCRDGLAALPPEPAAPRERTALLLRLASTHGQHGRYAEAIAGLEQALALARYAADPWLTAAILNNLGRFLNLVGQKDRALMCYAESLQLKDRIGDVAGRISTLINHGVIYQQRGDYEAALRGFEEACALSERPSLPERLAWATVSVGFAQFMQGRLNTATTCFERAQAIFQSLDDAYGMTDCLYRLSDVALAQRDARRAYSYGEQALELARRIDNAAYESCALRVIGEALLQEGRINEAVEHLDKAWHIQEQVRDAFDQTLILAAQARLAQVQGDQQQALAHVQVGLELARMEQFSYQIGLLEQLQKEIGAPQTD